ncbi:hypothetical protein [Thalassomonas haliotis]|uniref:Uncharacterized protein n=1 Tax=Thalassomonas haliotis TaxID=485448 RepID=A0ABY7VEN3_9GAMM|nr:hypothetical protein [Thalassomonas haliotis]WDE11604.1 hypothetical protein H3N35_25955 [Thalassomonas haliotis]
MFKKRLSLTALACAFAFSANSNAQDHTYLIDCGQSCNDLHQVVGEIIALESQPFSSNDMFKLLDSGIEVNSITYQQYLSDTDNTPNFLQEIIPADSFGTENALACESDRDYDCEAWNDYTGAYKSYIVALQNQVYDFEWSYSLTQSDIDAIDTAARLQYNFSVGVATSLPATRLVSMLVQGLQVSIGKIASHLMASGVTNVIIGELFRGPAKTKLKAGDVVVVKKGRIVSIVRNGIAYSPATLTGTGSGSGGSGSGGSSSNYGSGTDLTEIPYKPLTCYSRIHGGDYVRVPCV